MNKTPYIAYGSNMDTDQMKYRCPTAELLGLSELDGWRLLFKGSRSGAYATIEKAEESKVPVLIWSISTTDEQSLDRYEGFPHFYYKETVIVRLNGKTYRAMVYIMHENRPFGIPSRQYYKVLEDAYLQFGFNMDVLQKALDDTIEQENDDGKSK